MARIPDEVIEQVRDAADLVDIVQEQVPLKRTGSDWRGACPFHGGTHRNFTVFPKENRYYCFVCHAAGDVFTWYRERFGMDYPTAVREVARRCGVVIPEATDRTGPDPREPLFEACDAAQTWFAAQLRDAPEAEPARRYLQSRGLALDAAARIGLGYAPRGAGFLGAMKQLGIGEPVLLEAALVMRRDDGSLASRFRDRLLFPIDDLRGRVVGFGGRTLGASEPKYLNSPETPIFRKGEQLYHLHVARNAIRKTGYAVLVEGYFDVQRLALAGLDQVVAPLGTALTESQAALLRRYAGEVVLLYDSDTAGLKATFRAGDILLAHGVRVRTGTLPPGDDPDTLVQRDGVAAIERIITDAVDILERKLQLLDARGWFGDVHKAREAMDRLLPTLRAAADPVLRELYITRVAEQLGIPREAVATEAQVRSAPPRAATTATTAPRPERRSAVSRAPGAEIERKLLRILVQHPEWMERARGEIAPERFESPVLRRIFEALVTLPPAAPIGDALERLGERERDVWERLAARDSGTEGFDLDREYAGALAALEEIRSFPAIAAVADPAERRRRVQALSPAGQARFRLYLATGSRHRFRRDASLSEE